MIKYPISRRDLLRTVMMQVPAAGVVYADPVLQQFHSDSAAGLCTMELVATETRTVMERVKDLGRPGQYSITQTHYMQICYSDPELEFERRLSC